MPIMAEPTTVRFNSEDRPDRADKFQEAVEKYQLNMPGVLRKLVDAFLAYIEDHGQPPLFPVELVQRGKAPKKPK